ncbi:glycosyltransferase family 4 protein [Citricoccus nitrophenolicus]|uniref:glycosyltransferase family 4 protein n=1 Tax=Citricoccus nitrophenolicus TaxID=863575 RepID=UPI0031F07F6C
MKVLVLTQYYDPEPVPIPGQIARGLRDRGHQVRVLTAAPSYPSGTVYNGFENKRSIIVADGIPVHRVGSLISHSQSAVGRFASYAGFAVSAARERALIRGADVVYVYATQMTASIPADLWSGWHETPFVLHVQDLWPESVTESTMVPQAARRIIDGVLDPWLRGVYTRSSGLIAIAPTMSEVLQLRSDDHRKVHTLLNWSVEDGRMVVPRDERAEASGLNLLYAGNVGDLQGLDVVIDALSMTKATGVRLRIVGAGSSLDDIRRRAAGLLSEGQVEFYDPVPRDQLVPHLNWSDFQLIPLRDLEIFRGTIPSKFQGSLREGIPVITNVPGDLARMVADEGLGFVARPGDAGSLSERIDEAARIVDGRYAELSRRSLDFYNRSMSAESALDRLEMILTDATLATTKG